MPCNLWCLMQSVEANRPETLRSVHVLAEHQFTDAKRVQSKRCPPAPRRPGRSWPHRLQGCCVMPRLDLCLMALKRSTSGSVLHCLLRLDDLTATAASVICRAKPPAENCILHAPIGVVNHCICKFHPICCELTSQQQGLTLTFRDSRGEVILATMRPR